VPAQFINQLPDAKFTKEFWGGIAKPRLNARMDLIAPRQVGDGAGQLEDAVIGALRAGTVRHGSVQLWMKF
jgi:hypothetical protein